jgi:hypothetical protein
MGGCLALCYVLSCGASIHQPEALADNALNKFTAEWEGTLREKAKLEDAKKKQVCSHMSC